MGKKWEIADLPGVLAKKLRRREEEGREE